MTSRAIRKAIRHGLIIVLRDNPWHTICNDLFGVLVVDTMRHEDFSPRMATITDKRKAVVFDPAMIQRKKRRTTKRIAA